MTLESTQSLLKEYSKERILFSLPSELPKDFSINCTKLSDGSYCTAYGSPENLHTLLNELSKVGLMPEKLEIGKANLEEAFIQGLQANDTIQNRPKTIQQRCRFSYLVGKKKSCVLRRLRFKRFLHRSSWQHCIWSFSDKCLEDECRRLKA